MLEPTLDILYILEHTRHQIYVSTAGQTSYLVTAECQASSSSECGCRDDYAVEELLGGRRGKFTVDQRKFRRDDLVLVSAIAWSNCAIGSYLAASATNQGYHLLERQSLLLQMRVGTT